MYNLTGTQGYQPAKIFSLILSKATGVIIIRRDRRGLSEDPPDSTPTENGRPEEPALGRGRCQLLDFGPRSY